MKRFNMIRNIVVVMPKKFFNFVQDVSHGKTKIPEKEKRRKEKKRQRENERL